jgi:hypothetical protein
MSGRTLHLRAGVLVTNRKTDRRRGPAPPLKDRLQEIALQGGSAAEPGQRVRMAFPLPRMIEPLVSPGKHSGGVEVLGRGFVRISNWSADRCFDSAQAFFRDTARDRPGFTVTAIIVNTDRPGERYSRHLTVVRGAVVISSGFHEPKIFERAA